MALVFPNAYSVGMSNLGFLYLYQRLNSYEEIVCERVFCQKEGKIASLESQRLLSEFPVLLYCLPFEMDYLNALRILKDSNIALNPKDRPQVVLGGGVAVTANPLPLLPFFDGFLFGEWEAMEDEVIPLLIEQGTNKESFLAELEKLPYFYSDVSPKTKVVVAKAKPGSLLPTSTLLSAKAEFQNSYLIEVSRGCGRGCRFCLAGYLFRPPRRHNRDLIVNFCKTLPRGGKVGLIGLEFADSELLLALWQILQEKQATLTFSSLRADSLTDDFLALLSTTKSIALAPETASEKLKRSINKVIPKELIFSLLEKIKKTGLKKVKLYFMYGLPGEELEDLMETLQFVRELKARKLPFRTRLSFSPFVPKPHTPFQWANLEDLETLEESEALLKRALRGTFEVRFEPIKAARLQALIARGDRDTGFALAEHLDLPTSKLIKALEPLAKNFEPRVDQSLPWDFIHTGVEKRYLFSEWIKSKKGLTSKACELGRCKLCSACSLITTS